MKKSNRHKLLMAVAFYFLTNVFNSNCLNARTLENATDLALSNEFLRLASSDVNTNIIPIQLVGNLICIQARVDTVIGNFIVDTGSERLILNKKYFRKYTGRNMNGMGMTGYVESSSEINIDTFQIDQIKVANLNAVCIDISHLEKSRKVKIIGIIGFEVLKEFEFFLDLPNFQIVLNKVDKKGNPLCRIRPTEIPNDSLEMEASQYLILIKGSVNNVPLRFMLDSGAELNLIDRYVGPRVLRNFTEIKKVNMVGVGNVKEEVSSGTLSGVICGNQICNDMRTLLTNLDELKQVETKTIHGILGLEFLSSRRVMVNYAKRKLYFYPILTIPAMQDSILAEVLEIKDKK